LNNLILGINKISERENFQKAESKFLSKTSLVSKLFSKGLLNTYPDTSMFVNIRNITEILGELLEKEERNYVYYFRIMT
jgi:hypothetical protein